MANQRVRLRCSPLQLVYEETAVLESLNPLSREQGRSRLAEATNRMTSLSVHPMPESADGSDHDRARGSNSTFSR